MQTIGITPDCVHCRFMVRQQNGEYRCRQHDIILHSPVRIFCKNLTPPVDSDDYKQWFETSIQLDKLDASVLYTWVDTNVKDSQGKQEMLTDWEMITPLTTYISWSAGTFWQVLRKIRQEKREHYREHGYVVEE